MSKPDFIPTDLSIHAIRIFDDGRFMTPPRDVIVDGFLTIVGRACEDYGYTLAAYSLMSSHPHLYVFQTDPRSPCRLDLFSQFVNACFAKFLNAYWERHGMVVDAKSRLKKVVVVDVDGEASTCVYIEANPVVAGLVSHPRFHNRATSLRSNLLEPMVVKRPDFWFGKTRWPDVRLIQLGVPPLAKQAGYDRQSWYDRTSRELEDYLEEVVERQARDGGFIGLARLQCETPDDAREAPSDHESWNLTGHDQVALARLYLAERRFQRAYRRAWQRLLTGDDDVTFPTGSVRIRRYGHRVRTRMTARAG